MSFLKDVESLLTFILEKVEALNTWIKDRPEATYQWYTLLFVGIISLGLQLGMFENLLCTLEKLGRNTSFAGLSLTAIVFSGIEGVLLGIVIEEFVIKSSSENHISILTTEIDEKEIAVIGTYFFPVLFSILLSLSHERLLEIAALPFIQFIGGFILLTVIGIHISISNYVLRNEWPIVVASIIWIAIPQVFSVSCF